MKFRNALGRARAVFVGTLLLALAASPVSGTLAAVAGELVVADQRSGVALFSFDAVGYFLHGVAEVGSEDIELTFSGFTWRFRNEANRVAFRAQPDVYVPRFGGHDPSALARGAPVSGYPEIFAVHGGQLYLFQKPAHRVSFLAAPDAAVEAARVHWPRVRRSLVH